MASPSHSCCDGVARRVAISMDDQIPVFPGDADPLNMAVVVSVQRICQAKHRGKSNYKLPFRHRDASHGFLAGSRESATMIASDRSNQPQFFTSPAERSGEVVNEPIRLLMVVLLPERAADVVQQGRHLQQLSP